MVEQDSFDFGLSAGFSIELLVEFPFINLKLFTLQKELDGRQIFELVCCLESVSDPKSKQQSKPEEIGRFDKKLSPFNF